MAVIRVRPDVRQAVIDPESKVPVLLLPGAEYDSSDPIVRAHAWAFGDGVESATSRPGEKRSTRRPRAATLDPDVAALDAR